MLKMSEYFTVNRRVVENAYSMDNTHTHSCFELIYIVSGSCKLLLSHNIHKMEPGDIAIVPAEIIHRTQYADNVNLRQERIVVRFDMTDIDWCNSLVEGDIIQKNLKVGVCAIPGKRKEYFEGLINRMVYEVRQPDELSSGMVKSLLQELIMFLVRCRNYGENAVREVDAEDCIIQEIATYVYENFEKPIYLNDVATKFSISRSYLSKKFKSTTGFGFKEYLLNVRIVEACRLLLETDKSITDIAFACGFNDSNYFGDAFKRIKGVAPNKYRRNPNAV